MKKIIVLILTLVAVLALMSFTAFAAESVTEADEVTPYGTIPAGTAAATDAPIALFIDNTYKNVYSSIIEAFNNSHGKNNAVIFLRSDYTLPSRYDNVAFFKNVTIDMNGKTLTTNGVNFVFDGKKSQTVNLTFTNGTIYSGSHFMEFGTSSNGNQTYNVSFNNVTLDAKDMIVWERSGLYNSISFGTEFCF